MNIYKTIQKETTTGNFVPCPSWKREFLSTKKINKFITISISKTDLNFYIVESNINYCKRLVTKNKKEAFNYFNKL